MKAADLRSKTDQELRDELLALRREQFNLRMQQGVNPDAVRRDFVNKQMLEEIDGKYRRNSQYNLSGAQ